MTRRAKKTDFALLIWKVFQQMKTETVMNGFKASGIYSWDYNAIDFSSLGTRTTDITPACIIPPCIMATPNSDFNMKRYFLTYILSF